MHVPEVIYHAAFRGWLDGLRDRHGRIKVVRRIKWLADGNPGDHKSAGGGMMEFRIDHGPGYRVYYKAYGGTLVVLFAGGDKSSQTADIVTAKALALEWKRSHD